MNARSLAGNFDKFKLLLSRLTVVPQVIGISETWLDETNSNCFDIPGYKFTSNHLTTKTHGGTGLYLRDQLEFKTLSECNRPYT